MVQIESISSLGCKHSLSHCHICGLKLIGTLVPISLLTMQWQLTWHKDYHTKIWLRVHCVTALPTVYIRMWKVQSIDNNSSIYPMQAQSFSHQSICANLSHCFTTSSYEHRLRLIILEASFNCLSNELYCYGGFYLAHTCMHFVHYHWAHTESIIR